jgi:hypothetical protein
MLSSSLLLPSFCSRKHPIYYLFSLIAVHYERCAEKLAHKRQKEKEKEMKLSAEEDLKERDKRKRYL